MHAFKFQWPDRLRLEELNLGGHLGNLVRLLFKIKQKSTNSKHRWEKKAKLLLRSSSLVRVFACCNAGRFSIKA